MSDRQINIGSGNYIHSMQGNYIQGNYVQGNHVESSFININQEPSAIAIQIQQRLLQLQAEGKLDPIQAKAITANELVNQTKAHPTFQQKLVTLFQYAQNAATSGLIGEATVEVVKLALNLLNIPLP